MAIALNLTIPLKQDPQSQENLNELEASFSQAVQPHIDRALASSRRVHFARIVVIKEGGRGRYLQVLTEFDGDPMDYTEFFRLALGPVFEKIFALAVDAPPWEELNTTERFFEYTHDRNLKSLGTSTYGDDRGYLFSAIGDARVDELLDAISAPTDTGHVPTAARS